VVAVGHDQRQTSRHVASNEQDWRERLALVNPLEILVHVGFVAREKRQLGGAHQSSVGPMAERVWRREDDDGAARRPHPPLRYRRNRQRSWHFKNRASSKLAVTGFAYK